MRDGGLGRHRPFHAHAHRHPGIAADGTIDPAGRPQPAMRQGDIFASHAAGLQLPYQMGLGGFIAGHDHQSGRVLVQPVHDAGAGHLGQLGIAVQQAIEQGAAPVAGAGMRHQPGGLVDHDPVRAGVHHLEIHGFGRESPRFGRGLRPDGQFVVGADHLPDLGRAAVDQHLAGLDPTLQAAAGMLGHEARQHLVQAIGPVPGGTVSSCGAPAAAWEDEPGRNSDRNRDQPRGLRPRNPRRNRDLR